MRDIQILIINSFYIVSHELQTADFLLLLIVDIASNASCVAAFIFIEFHMGTCTKPKQCHIQYQFNEILYSVHIFLCKGTQNENCAELKAELEAS